MATAVCGRLSDAELGCLMREEAGRLLAEGKYPTGDVIFELVGCARSSPRARRLFNAVLDSMELPEDIRRRREALRRGGEASNRTPKTKGLGISDEGLIERRVAVLEDYRALYARPLETGEIREILGLFDAACERKGVTA